MKDDDKHIAERIVKHFQESGKTNFTGKDFLHIVGRAKMTKIFKILEQEYGLVEKSEFKGNYKLTAKGYKFSGFDNLSKEENELVEHEKTVRINTKYQAEINKWFLKTKWWPLAIAIISLLVSGAMLYVSLTTKSNVETRLENLEKQIEEKQ